MAQFQHKIVFKNGEPCLLCSIFGAHSSSGITTIPQGCDVSLLWVPRGHVAVANNAVLKGTFAECGPINDFCNSKEFEDLYDQL